MNIDYDLNNPDIGGLEADHSTLNLADHGTHLDDILHQIMSDDHNLSSDDFHTESDEFSSAPHSDISFGSKYSDAEIQKMESDLDMAEHEMKCRENDMNNWRSKVSLNDTKEHRANGDYDNAVRHFNDAQSKYNSAVSRYNNALSKLNNAK